MSDKKCFYCGNTGYIHTEDDIPDQMCPYCEIGQAVIKGFNAARDIGIQANKRLENENKRLKEAMKEIAKSPQWRRVPNWVIIKIEQTLKES